MNYGEHENQHHHLGAVDRSVMPCLYLLEVIANEPETEKQYSHSFLRCTAMLCRCKYQPACRRMSLNVDMYDILQHQIISHGSALLQLDTLLDDARGQRRCAMLQSAESTLSLNRR